MEAIFMSAGIITAIVLCVVGLLKLPFEKFKTKHPKAYKATFTGLSIILTFGACLINQAFILVKPLFNIDFLVMVLSTYAGVFGLYLSYEGLGAKELVKRLLKALKNLRTAAPENKFIKYLDKIDIDQAIEIVNAKKETLTNQVVNAESVKVETQKVETQIINAEHIEINNTETKDTTINN